MYSVVILNSPTSEAFAEYHPLFLEGLKNGNIGLCKWNEDGMTIDTALPELRELTDDKEDWRAIIVRFADEEPMAGFRSDHRNPYDFDEIDSWEEIITESSNPLIRLTQMLGGVPMPEKRFQSRKIIEPDKAPRMVYEPVDDSERDASYRALSRKYEFDGKQPTSIILITLRRGYRPEDNIDASWEYHKESYSSNFWKHNHYPSICRFLVYDFSVAGPVQKTADEFGFWTSVMLMALNRIDSSTLQAYRLYAIKPTFDKEDMEETFQRTIDRLRLSRKTIRESMKRESIAQISSEPELPDYGYEVSVELDLPRRKESEVSGKGFRMTSTGIASDIAAWNTKRRNAEESLQENVRRAERILDQEAERMKEFSVYDPEEVKPLNEYQREDIIRETREYYRDIVEIQGELPTDKVTEGDEAEEISDNVVNYLRGRVCRRPAFIAAGIAAALLLLAQIPAVINIVRYQVGSGFAVFGSVALGLILIAFGAVTVLAIQRLELKRRMDAYNRLLFNAFNRLTNSARNYSDYLTSIVSHSRGVSYLDIAEGLDKGRDELKVIKLRHIKSIDVFLNRIRDWGIAYHLGLDYDLPVSEEKYMVNLMDDPSENALYTFDVGNTYPVSVNRTGFTIDSPFDFITKLEILREELYDDTY